MPAFTLDDVRELTYKRRDAWWTVLLVDPLAARLVTVTANRTSITPNQLTVLAAILGLGAAACFAMASPVWLIAGAVLFHFSFVVDCMDGKIARLKGTGSVFGVWLDFLFDRVRDLVCAVALMGGQFAVTGQPVYLWFAVGIIAVEMFRYLNGPQLAKVRTSMRNRMTQALRELNELQVAHGTGGSESAGAESVDSVLGTGEGLEGAEDEETELTPAQVARRRAREVQATELQDRFHRRFPFYIRLRTQLREYRIRSHLFSGIEFTMGVFVVAPLVGVLSPTAMLVTIALCGVFLLAFEMVLIYKLWLSTRRFSQVITRIDSQIAELTTTESGGVSAADSSRSHSVTVG